MLREVLPTRKDEALILRINIPDEEPGTDTVVLQRHLVFLEELLIVLQERLCLAVAAAFAYHQPHRPEVFVAVVANCGRAQSVGIWEDFRSTLQIDPSRDFASIERRLLNVRDGARIVLLHEGPLVGSIREEVPFEDRLCAFNVLQFKQLRFRLTDAPELLLERLAPRFDMQNRMEFRSLLLWGKGRQFDCGTDFFKVFFLKLHGALCGI